jgi:hypothetical protein
MNNVAGGFMHTNRRTMGYVVAGLLCVGIARLASAQTAATDTKQESLQSVLDRIHEHASHDAWRAQGWKDEQIEAWLDRVTTAIATAAQLSNLKVPVRMADVTPADAASDTAADKSLIVGENASLSKAHLRSCVVLADGNVEVDSLQNCVVIARGAVAAKRLERSIVVAGIYARVSSQSEWRRDNEDNSLIVTRGWANVADPTGVVIAALEGTTIESSIGGGIFVNASLVSNRNFPARTRPRTVKVRGLPLEELSEHPLGKKIELVGVVYPEEMQSLDRFVGLRNRDNPRPKPTGIVVRFNGRRYAIDRGEPIRDQSGNPVSQLADWKLSYIDEDIAIFSSDDADAIVRIEPN